MWISEKINAEGNIKVQTGCCRSNKKCLRKKCTWNGEVANGKINTEKSVAWWGCNRFGYLFRDQQNGHHMYLMISIGCKPYVYIDKNLGRDSCISTQFLWEPTG